MAACPQLRDELVREDLGAAPGERHLRAQNRDAHVVSLALLRLAEERELGLEAATRCSRSSTSLSAAALNDRWSYASGSTYQRIGFRRTAFAGVPTAAEARSQPQRPVGRHGPEALGLGARGAPIVRFARGSGIGARAPDLLVRAAKSASTSTSSVDGKPLSVASSGTGAVYPSACSRPPRSPRTAAGRDQRAGCARSVFGCNERPISASGAGLAGVGLRSPDAGRAVTPLVPGISGGSETYARELCRPRPGRAARLRDPRPDARARMRAAGCGRRLRPGTGRPRRRSRQAARDDGRRAPPRAPAPSRRRPTSSTTRSPFPFPRPSGPTVLTLLDVQHLGPARPVPTRGAALPPTRLRPRRAAPIAWW